MREYEFTCITRSDLSDADMSKFTGKYEEILLRGGGQVLKKTDWGVKRLAYPIKKQYRGRYLLYDFVALKENITEAERLMRIDENVLRYMSMNIGEDIDIEKRKIELVKIAEAQLQQAQANNSRDY